MAGKRNFAWAAVLLGFPGCLLANGSDRAFEKLRISLSRTCAYNVCALIDQRDPLSEGWQRVKIDRDGRGRVRKCVLQPLSMQGVESVDNGDRWLTLLPDERVVLDEESPLKRPCDDDQRVRLAQRNYRFRLDGKSEVAGREVLRILARPLHRQLDAHRYYLDAETLYPLKMETVRGNHTSVDFVTVDVTYPAHLDENTFTLSSEYGMRHVRYERPEDIRSISAARTKLGFRPLLPKELPLGFEIQEMQIDDSPSWKSLVVRLTDGLARATVYEYSASDQSVTLKALDNSSSAEAEGVKILLVSPLSADARESLIGAFMSSKHVTFDWGDGFQIAPERIKELLDPHWMLADIDQPFRLEWPEERPPYFASAGFSAVFRCLCEDERFGMEPAERK